MSEEYLNKILNQSHLYESCISDCETANALSMTCKRFYNLVSNKSINIEAKKIKKRVLSITNDDYEKRGHFRAIMGTNKFYFNCNITLGECSKKLWIKNKDLCFNWECFDNTVIYSRMENREQTKSILIEKYLELSAMLINSTIELSPNLQTLTFGKISICGFTKYNHLFANFMDNLKSTKLTELIGINYKLFMTYIQNPNCLLTNLPNIQLICLTCNDKADLLTSHVHHLAKLSNDLGKCKFMFETNDVFNGSKFETDISEQVESIAKNGYSVVSSKIVKNQVKPNILLCEKILNLVEQLKRKNIYPKIATYPSVESYFALKYDHSKIQKLTFLKSYSLIIRNTHTYGDFCKLERNISLFNGLKKLEIKFIENVSTDSKILEACKILLLPADAKLEALKIRHCPLYCKEFAKELSVRFLFKRKQIISTKL
uniref:F-box domain-containing protein n=1 Tax=Rhabditophanes sp. KR3021 TaxID=114890 RepID=A0AC35UAL2_9BILA